LAVAAAFGRHLRDGRFNAIEKLKLVQKVFDSTK
jgi:hypothetical protein